MSGIAKEVFDAANQRLSSPILGFAVLSLVLVNYDDFLLLFWGSGTMDERLVAFKPKVGLLTYVVVPTLAGLGSAVVTPWVKYAGAWMAVLPTERRRVLQEGSAGRVEIARLEQRKERSELELELQRANSLMERQRAEAERARADAEEQAAIAETQRAEAEQQRARAAEATAEAEKAEAEKAEAEARRQVAEAEEARARNTLAQLDGGRDEDDFEIYIEGYHPTPEVRKRYRDVVGVLEGLGPETLNKARQVIMSANDFADLQSDLQVLLEKDAFVSGVLWGTEGHGLAFYGGDDTKLIDDLLPLLKAYAEHWAAQGSKARLKTSSSKPEPRPKSR